MTKIQYNAARATENPYLGPAQSIGYLKTNGQNVVDSATGQAVRLVGANWHGAESDTKVPGGLWARNWRDMMDEMADSGLNVLRIPISPAILEKAAITDGIRWDINPDLEGLNGLGVLDRIVEHAGDLGMRIVIDMHRITPGVGKQESGLWFSGSYSEDDLVRDWQTIAKHYAGDPTVIGFDLFNEPSGRSLDPHRVAHWADGPAVSDWHRAAERLGDAVHEVNPDALILVEGVHVDDGKWYWVGGNLKGAADDPIRLKLDDKLIYSPHDYPYSVQNVPWLKNASVTDMKQNFQKHWGYLAETGKAPVMIGETGARFAAYSDTYYFEALIDYLESVRDDPDGGIGLTWWTWGVNSGDTAGLLDNWYSVNQERLGYVQRVAGKLMPVDDEANARVHAAEMTFTFEHTNNSDRERVFAYTTRNGSAKDGSDFVGESGFIRLAAGETKAEIDIKILSDALANEGSENFWIDVNYLGGKVFHSMEGIIVDGEIAAPAPSPSPSPSPSPIPEPMPSPTLVMPDMLADPDAQQVYHLRDSRLVLQADAQDDGSVLFVASFRTWGGTINDVMGNNWRLRFEGLSELDYDLDVHDLVNVTVKGGDALVFDTDESRIEGLREMRFAFEMDLPKLSLDWAATGVNASGTALAGLADSAGPLQVEFDIEQSWASGDMLGVVTVTNVSDRTIRDWDLTIDADGFDFVRSKVHNAYITSSDGGETLDIQPFGWGAELSAGESYKFSFNGVIDHDAANVPAPEGFAQSILEQLNVELI